MQNINYMAISEASDHHQLLSIESFSYSWLVNLGGSFRFSIDGEAASPSSSVSFIEMDPKLPPSKRFLKLSVQDLDFNFDLACSPSEQPTSTADMIFSNGMFNPQASKINDGSKAADNREDGDDGKQCSLGSKSSSLTATPQIHILVSRRIKCSSLRRCASLTKKVFRRYLKFLWPIYHMLRGGLHQRSSIGSKVRSLDDHHTAGMLMMPVGSKLTSISPGASLRVSVASSTSSSSSCTCRNWRRSCDSESSIYEAVLHCKRSIGK